MSTKISIRPLAPELWPAFEDLFDARGPCSKCWCMYWRIGAAYRKRPADQNKAGFQHSVMREP